MKKLLAILLTVATLLSTCVVVTTAAGSFTPCGNQEVTWDPDAASKITLDGNIEDWRAAGYARNEITMDNMVMFDNEQMQGDTMPEGFKINTYYVSDADYLYVGFYVTDDDVCESLIPNDPNYYSYGDAFQIAIDFNGEAKRLMESDPGYFTTINASQETIFYSFVFPGNGNDIQIVRQNKKGTAGIEVLDQSKGGWGKAGLTSDGWCAEFALSWQMLYDDFMTKSFIGAGYKAVVNQQNPLKTSVFLSYLNATEEGPLKGAAGTFATADGSVADGITPTDSGLTLVMDYEEGMTFNCTGIQVGTATDDTPSDGKGLFDSFDKLSNFSETNVTYYFSGANGSNGMDSCTPSYNEDGSIHVVANAPAADATEIVANLDFNYFGLISGCYTGFPEGLSPKAKKELMPNKYTTDGAYTVMVLKIKRSEAAQMQDPYMYFQVGDSTQLSFGAETMIWSTPVKAIDADDGYEYLLFNAADYPEFSEDYINTLRFTWVNDMVYEDTVAGDYTMDIYAFNMYKSLDEAMTDLGLELANGNPQSKPTETESNSETDEEPSDTETGDDESATTPTETTPVTETEASGGCGSVVGLSAAAVVLSAMAAAVALKKKDD